MLNQLKQNALKEIAASKELKDLDAVYRRYLGRKGELTKVLRSLKDLSEKERKETGTAANEIKRGLEEAVGEKRREFLAPSGKTPSLSRFGGTSGKTPPSGVNWLDVTAPGVKPAVGHLHPITLVQRQVEDIFQSMGFSVVDGPEVETEYYNFDALNIPPGHPARDVLSLGRTFYLKKGGLMRSHTSPMQIRYMEKHNPPIRMIVPGKVFRVEATDSSHETNFYQLEGLMIGKDVSVANFKAVIQEFLENFFKKSIKVKLRPSYFPFVEPGFEIDMSCTMCVGKGCAACKYSGWIEMMGAGMIHPKVLKSGGLDPKKWQGFAFGMSLDRLTMIKYRINDIRLFHSGDLRFLQQF